MLKLTHFDFISVQKKKKDENYELELMIDVEFVWRACGAVTWMFTGK